MKWALIWLSAPLRWIVSAVVVTGFLGLMAAFLAYVIVADKLEKITCVSDKRI
jgi:hypothetical protein